MDNFVQEKLTQWGLYEILQEFFNAQQIDEEAFETLTDKDIEDLIPVIGLRRKFLNKYTNYQLIVKSSEKPPLIDVVDNDFTNVASSPSTSTATNLSHSSIFTDEDSIKNSTSTDGLLALSYPQKATVGVPFIITQSFGIQSTVRKLIEETDEGKLIAASYRAGKTFLRSKLSELIIKNELKEDKNKRITSTRFRQLAEEINEVFLHENPEIYYVAYVKNKNGKPKAARGKLWNTYTYLRRNYKTLGIIPCTSKSAVTDDPTETIAIDEEINFERIQWLKNNAAPISVVEEYWKSTVTSRQQNFPSSIQEYFQTYPCLKQPSGYIYLEIDFDHLYPDKGNLLFCKWPQLSSLIVKLAEHKKDSYLKTIIDTYKSQNEDNFSGLDHTVFALTILPLFFQCVNIKSKKRGLHWKLSKIEIQEGFLLHVKDMVDVETSLEQRKEKYAAFHLTAQPLPVIVGELCDIQACYVCIDEIRYKVDTPVKAVDLCFKAFQATQAEYPKESDVVWTFIQSYIYNINTKYDRKYVSVSSLIADIEKYSDLH